MKLSLFSVSYAGFWGQQALDLPGVIAAAGRSGYDAVMLMGKRPHLSPLDVTPELILKIQGALRSHRVECSAIGAYTDFAGPTAAEVPYFEMQISYVESLAKLAVELGAPIVRVFTSYEHEGGPAPQAAWDRTVAGLREVCDRARSLGITIAVQNHHDIGVHSDALLELLGDVDRPNCKLGFDAWSPALRGESLYETAKRMAPHTALTTNADYIRLPRYRYQPTAVNYLPLAPDLVRAVKFGQGFIDYPAFFQGLVDGGFQGVAAYEMCSPIRGGGSQRNLDEYAGHYVGWMRERKF